MPRFASNLSLMFQEHAFADRLAAAAQAGFRAVECQFPYEVPAAELARRRAALDIPFVALNLPPGDWDAGDRGLAAQPGREAEFEAAFDRALAYATALDCPKMHAMTGNICANDPAEMRATLVANLRAAAPRAAAEGVTIVVEPLNTRDNPGYYLTSWRLAREIIEEVAADNVGLMLDLYHCQIMEGDLAAHLDDYADITRHIQVAGVPGRHEPDVGEINYPYLFGRIDASGYDGWVGCEYKPRGDTVAGLGWLDAVS